MIVENIQTALDNGFDETQLVESLEVTYLELRQFCILHNIDLDFSFISEGLVLELLDNADWKAPKLAARYNISLSVMNRIVHGLYPLSVKKPRVDKYSIKTLVEAQYSVKDMAAQLGVSVYYVKKALAKFGLAVQRGKLSVAQYDAIVEDLQSGLVSQKDLAEQYGVNQSMISYIKAQVMEMPERKRHIKADPELVVKLVDQGHTQQSIAKQLNIAQGTVSRLYKENK